MEKKIAKLLVEMLESHALDGDIAMMNPNLEWKDLGNFYAKEIANKLKEK